MLPLIVSAASPEAIEQYLQKENHLKNIHSRLIPTGKSISVEEIRNFKEQTKYSIDPSSPVTYLIENGEKMTPTAQNALLKTFEEARDGQQFIITTNNHLRLLPTILSRCHLVILDSVQTDATDEFFARLVKGLAGPVPDLVALADEIIAADAPTTIEQIITKMRQANRHTVTPKRTKIIGLALNCLSDLHHNISPKLAVDHFLLKSHSVVTMNPAHS